jgi:hypothetical protein
MKEMIVIMGGRMEAASIDQHSAFAAVFLKTRPAAMAAPFSVNQYFGFLFLLSFIASASN